MAPLSTDAAAGAVLIAVLPLSSSTSLVAAIIASCQTFSVGFSCTASVIPVTRFFSATPRHTLGKAPNFYTAFARYDISNSTTLLSRICSSI